MEIDSVKVQLQHILAMHEDVNVNDDDIVYATIAMMRQAHVVAQMLLLEGRYGELQRCLELCRVTLGETGPPSSREADGQRLSGSRSGSNPSARADKSGSLRSSASLHGVLSQMRASSGGGATGSFGSGVLPVRRALQNLSEEDRFLFRCLRSRTEQLQRQLDVARATRPGRDTAYYIRKLVAAAAPVPDPREEERARRMTHTGSIVVLPRLRQASSSAETPARPPTPPERGVSIGRRTKLNRWKVLHELPPLVTSSKTFFSSKTMQEARTRSNLRPAHLTAKDGNDEAEAGAIAGTTAGRSWRRRRAGKSDRAARSARSPTAELVGSPVTGRLQQSVLPMIELEQSDESCCYYDSSGSEEGDSSDEDEDEGEEEEGEKAAKASAQSAMLRSETLTRFVGHAPLFYSAANSGTELPNMRGGGSGSPNEERADLTRAWSPRHASPVSLAAASASTPSQRLGGRGGAEGSPHTTLLDPQSPAEATTPSRALPQSIYRSNMARLASRSALLARRGQHSPARPARRLHTSSPLTNTSPTTTSTQSPLERSPTAASASAHATPYPAERELTEATSSTHSERVAMMATPPSSSELPPSRALSADAERRHEQLMRSEARTVLLLQPPRAPPHNYALERTAAAAQRTTTTTMMRPASRAPDATRAVGAPISPAAPPRGSAERTAAAIRLATSALRSTAMHLAEAQARGSAVLRRRATGGLGSGDDEDDDGCYLRDEEGVMSYGTAVHDGQTMRAAAEGEDGGDAMAVLRRLSAYPTLSPEAHAALQALQEDYVRQKQLNAVQQRELRTKAEAHGGASQVLRASEKGALGEDMRDWRSQDVTRPRKPRRATPPPPPPILSPPLSSFPATPMAARSSATRGARGNPLHNEDTLPSLTGLNSSSSFFTHISADHEEANASPAMTAAVTTTRSLPRSALAQLISSSLCSEAERGPEREEAGWGTMEMVSDKELRARSISAHIVRSVPLLPAFVPQASIVQTLYEDRPGSHAERHARLLNATLTNSTLTPSVQREHSRGASEVAALLRAINAHARGHGEDADEDDEAEEEKSGEAVRDVQAERMQHLMTTSYQFHPMVHCIVARHQLQHTTGQAVRQESGRAPHGAHAEAGSHDGSSDRDSDGGAAALRRAVAEQDMTYLPTLQELRRCGDWCALPPALLRNCLALELHATVIQRNVRRRLAARLRLRRAQRIRAQREAEVRRDWAVMLLQRCVRGHQARRRAAGRRGQVRGYIEQCVLAERAATHALRRATLSPSSEFDLPYGEDRDETEGSGRSRGGSASTRAPVCASFMHTDSMVFDFTLDAMPSSRGESPSHVVSGRVQHGGSSRRGSTNSGSGAAAAQGRRRSHRSPSVHPFAASLRRRASQATPASCSDLALRESPFQTSLGQSRRGTTTTTLQPLFVAGHRTSSGGHCYSHGHHYHSGHRRRSGTRLSFSVGPGGNAGRSRRVSAVTLSQPSPLPPPPLSAHRHGGANAVLFVKFTSNHGLSHRVNNAAGRLRELQRRLAARAIQRCYRDYRNRVLTRMQAEARTMTRFLTQRLPRRRALRALAAPDLCPETTEHGRQQRHSCNGREGNEEDGGEEEAAEAMSYDAEEDEGEYEEASDEDEGDEDEEEEDEKEAMEDDGANVRRLMRLYGAEVYERYVRRMQRACHRGDLFCPLRRINLGELRRLRQRRDEEAAAAQRAREAAKLAEEEERLRHERRVLEAVLVLQRVGRACQRRRGLRAHAAAAQERQRVHHRPAELLPQYARQGLSATRRPYRAGSPRASAESALGDFGSEDVLAQTDAPAVIAGLLRRRHPSWFEASARTEHGAAVALMLQRFVHAALSTRLAFRRHLDRLAGTIQRAWRAYRAHAGCNAMYKVTDVSRRAPGGGAHVRCT